MAIIAVCPYCKSGKVRAPDSAVGASATCPRCFNCFTVVATSESRGEPAGVRLPPSRQATSKRPPAEVHEETPIDANDPPTVAETQRNLADPTGSNVRLPPIVAPLPPPPVARSGGDSSFALSMVTFVLAGVAIGVTYLPFGRIVGLAFALLGLVIGLLALVIAERRRLYPALGLGVHLFVVILLAFLPSWLGLGQWLPPRGENLGGTRFVPFDGKPGYAVEDGWVEANLGGWQRGDVRVSVAMASVGKIELMGPKDALRVPKEKMLVVNVRLQNVGAGRVIDYRSWSEAPPPEGASVRVTDPAGTVLAARNLDPGWRPRGRTRMAQLFPSQAVEDVLLFDAPPPGVEFVNLELPAWAFGETGGPARLRVPRSMLEGQYVLPGQFAPPSGGPRN